VTSNNRQACQPRDNPHVVVDNNDLLTPKVTLKRPLPSSAPYNAATDKAADALTARIDRPAADPGQTFGQTNYDAPVRMAQDERVESEGMTCTDTDVMTHARSGQHARGALITRRSRVQIPPPPPLSSA
jgi:hypothetical protein